ncbi:unnamed protein product [Vitrella brassicaformis CCMP3155]|uniref:Uncharacterized protein n=1 Tax=Vitrella brassicaformis (strain CCMP3155) TaxID=1169540 RepID=A0A0G4F970_VITBC|nr:unnamed protein product [Vitrella brassicaformis CCMP3155]|eukprot:CEM08777.1 unnamed protein product [Vitrella brassicaformis CCMP3155]
MGNIPGAHPVTVHTTTLLQLRRCRCSHCEGTMPVTITRDVGAILFLLHRLTDVNGWAEPVDVCQTKPWRTELIPLGAKDFDRDTQKPLPQKEVPLPDQ